MEILIEKACGLDVHKDAVVACIMGTEIKKEIQTFSTTSGSLLTMKKWLSSNGITHVAMESTGVYWKPIFNILEGSFKVVLVNAGHIKNVPGRKTDVKDCEWICKLLRSGLLNASFIPSVDIRDLRDLVRYRRKLHEEKTKEKNRIHKILEDANIKLSGVLTDIFGVTGMLIIKRMIEGKTDPLELSELAKGSLKNKKREIQEALTGNIREHHKFMIQSSLEHIKNIEELIESINNEIDGHSILITCYIILKRKIVYQEFTLGDFDTRKKEKIATSYIKRLSKMGFDVTLNKPVAETLNMATE